MSPPPLDDGPAVAVGPHTVSERIDVLDVLRGIALFGMYVVHFGNYAAEAAGDSPTTFMRGLEHVVGLFFDGRFYTMFGILFGVGFALQLRRADARGDRFVARFLRRLAALAVFGIIAEGVFGYNVLFGYAVWGVPLLLVRRWPVRALVVLLLLSAASRPIYNISRVAVLGPDRVNTADKDRGAAFRGALAAHESAEQADTWRTVVPARLRFMPAFHRQWSLLPWGSFTLFLIGLIAFRLGMFDHPEEHRRLIIACAAAGIASWAFATWVLPIGPRPPQVLPSDLTAERMARTIARVNAFMLVRDAWLAFAYIGGVLLLVAHNRAWVRRLAPFAWTGRMALTNYMTQVILLDSLFTPHGLGITVTPAMVPLGAITLFAVQAALSRWWLARYRLGPLEWVWRSVTYWHPQPMRIAAPVVAGATSTA
jgi:uncharacterized protein